MAMPALWPNAVRFANLQEREFSDRAGLRIDFRSVEPTGGVNSHFIECRFREPGRPRKSEDLVGVLTDEGPLSEGRRFFLIRFWLATPEGRAADPFPLGDVSRLPRLPPIVAYGLQQVLNGLPLAAVYGLVASAYALIYGLVGRVNLAFGAFVAVGGYATVLGSGLAGPEWPRSTLLLGAALASATAAGWGLAAARWTFLPLRNATGQQNLVASVGLALALSEFLRLTQGPRLTWLGPLLNQPFGLAQAQGFVVTATPVALGACAACLGVALGLVLIMRVVSFGRRWRAFADDPLGAELFGVDGRALYAQSFGLACGLAGLAGFVLTVVYGAVGYGASTEIGLKALVAAVLGGIGAIEGALIGGVIVGLIEALWSAYFPADYRDVALYALLAILLTLRPGGILGARETGPNLDPRT